MNLKSTSFCLISLYSDTSKYDMMTVNKVTYFCISTQFNSFLMQETHHFAYYHYTVTVYFVNYHYMLMVYKVMCLLHRNPNKVYYHYLVIIVITILLSSQYSDGIIFCHHYADMIYYHYPLSLCSDDISLDVHIIIHDMLRRIINN